jgi:hypothetical protein
VAVSRRNIGHCRTNFIRIFRNLGTFGTWTENPRVGGSIPPLATIFQRSAIGVCRRYWSRASVPDIGVCLEFMNALSVSVRAWRSGAKMAGAQRLNSSYRPRPPTVRRAVERDSDYSASGVPPCLRGENGLESSHDRNGVRSTASTAAGSVLNGLTTAAPGTHAAMSAVEDLPRISATV